jgi:ABC-2 type transport system permease protein
MSSLSYVASDSTTMVRRNIRHALRYPSMTLSTVIMPILMLLLFVFVFGKALGTGIGGSGMHGRYIDYIAPGIFFMAAASGAMTTSVAVCTDMAEGIINRFRTMAISRGSVLTGHVIGSLLQTMLSIGLVIGVSLLAGFRPSAGPGAWAEGIALLALASFALTWLSAALGLMTDKVETASNLPLPLMFLPFLGSAIVPIRSMPAGIRWFAEYQPFTPLIETLRGLLMGTHIGDNAVIALAWCAAIGIAGYLWARAAFRRGRV